MKAWVLYWRDASYGDQDGAVVVAATEQRAREVAAGNPDETSRTPWLDPTQTTCDEVELDADEVVLTSNISV